MLELARARPATIAHVPPKQNPMRAALAMDKVQIGTWINLARNPAILTLLKSAGLDYARLDMEHSSPSIETVADMAVLARALDFPLVVRPPEGNREWITRLLLYRTASRAIAQTALHQILSKELQNDEE